MYQGIPGPHPDPLVTITDAAPDPFYHQANIVRKTFITTVLQLLYYFQSLKHEVKCTTVPNPRSMRRIRMFWGLPDPHTNPLEVRIRTKISRIPNSVVPWCTQVTTLSYETAATNTAATALIRVGVEYRYYHFQPNNAIRLPPVAESGSITDPDRDPDQSFLGQRKLF